MRPNRAPLRHRFSFACLMLTVAACATPEPRPPVRITPGDFRHAEEYLDWLIRTAMTKADIPGCAVAVVSRDGVLFQKAYGVSSKRTGRPVTTKTFFRAGSITKSLTALAVMRLRAEGKLDLDQPVSDYLPEFSVKSRFAAAPITPRHLLAHRSGLPGDYFAGIMGEKRLTPGELVAALNEEYLCFPPGEVFLYSNTGYGLLGALIERVTGRRYEEYVKTEIMNRIGLGESALELTPAIAADLAAGHMSRSLGFFPGGRSSGEVPYVPIRDSAAGALLTNIEDLGKYAQFLLADKETVATAVVSEADFGEMIKPQFADRPDRIFLAVDYGLGFMRGAVRPPGVTDCVHHTGNVNGFYSFLVFSPSRGLGMALLTNSSSGFFSCYDIVSRGFRRFLEGAAGEAPAPARPAGEERSPPRPDRESLRLLTGRYAVLGVAVDIELRGDDLWMVFPPAKLDLLLVPAGPNRFTPQAMLLGFIPAAVAPFLNLDRAAASFELRPEGGALLILEGGAGDAVISLALRRTEQRPLPDSFDRFLGTYEIAPDPRNQEALDLYLPIKELVLEKRDGWLSLRSPQLGADLRLALNPAGDHEALLLGSNETVFFEDGAMVFSGLRAKRK